MKILVVCQYYYPENFQINDICEYMAADGHDVTVLTGLPNYPTGIIPDEYKHGKRRDEVINGVHVIRCFEIGRKKGAVGLAANYFSYFFSASTKVKKIGDDFDLIFAYQQSPVLMVNPAKILKERANIPMVLYCCDIWPESMKVMIKNEKSLLYRILTSISRKLYQSANKIVVQSKFFIEYFEMVHQISGQKSIFIPHFGDSHYLEMDLLEEKQSNASANFVFLGNIGIAQDIDTILSAIEIIKNLDFLVHLVGDGTYLEKAKEIVSNKGISHKVRFYGKQPLEDMPKYYRIADACLLTLKDDSYIGKTIPSKLQGYMAAGKPVIAAINGAAKDVITEAKCGECVPASDYSALADLMKDFIDNPDKYKSCGENGREYFRKHFTKEQHMKQLYAVFDGVLEENRNVAIKR
jgi:glycosyltransferase involved in cell wall biosynthesis